METNINTKHGTKLLYKELSYQIQGAAIEVRKNFGSGLKEAIYQNAFAEELRSRNLQFEKEKSIQIFSPKTGKLIGSYRPDFIVDGKILVELKAVEKIPKLFLDQVYSYLRNSEYELGYFINFVSPKLYMKRVIFTNDRKPFLTNTRKITKLSCLLVFLFVLFSVSSEASGAELYFGAHSQEIGINKTFEIGVFVNTEGELVNAIEGEVVFPRELEVVGVRDGNSILNLWIKKPQLAEAGRVSFAGVIPGGYFGNRGQLFSLVLQAKNEGPITITTSDERILLNDGQGTPTDVRRAPLILNVSQEATTEEFSPPLDSDSPESFTPVVSRNQNIFDNKYFLVFATQDKGSGIKEYQVQERKFFGKAKEKKWVTAESPYLLGDQKLRSYIFVKAIDNAGNERLETLTPQTPWYKDYTVWGIIILIMISAYLIRRNLWKKLLRHKSPRILDE